MTDSIKMDTVIGAKEQEILEKYDRESVTRQSTGHFNKWLITIIAVLYSLFHLYITFYPLPTLIQRSVHVGVGAILIFFSLPCFAKKP